MSGADIALRICIDVDDLERGVDFFTRGLGLRVARRFGESFAELAGAPVPIDLLAEPAGSVAAAAATRDYRRHWTPVHLDLVVDGLEAAVARAVAAGALIERPIAARPWGRIAGLADPFGHGFCLLEMSDRGYDALAEPADPA